MPSDLGSILESDVAIAAPALLGCFLEMDGLKARIVETEAYSAESDPGSHAWRGRTPRNATMFGRPGLAYVYFTYGMYWMLNVVAHSEGSAAAVLIRAAEPIEGIELMASRRPSGLGLTELLSGPAKLTTALAIDRAFDGVDLLNPSSPLRLVSGEAPAEVLVGRRVGLTTGKGELIPWRFADASRVAFVSPPRNRFDPQS